ncbi:MAG: hypothetical protein K5925_00460, partial [Bacilli bacterium]|nr:hypothetical protein [Bacilli bacterium]
ILVGSVLLTLPFAHQDGKVSNTEPTKITTTNDSRTSRYGDADPCPLLFFINCLYYTMQMIKVKKITNYNKIICAKN